MKFRKLRIAWSVGCGIACVLLIAVWVRSQHHWDSANGPLLGKELIATSRNGGVALGWGNRSISKWHVRHVKETNLVTRGLYVCFGLRCKRRNSCHLRSSLVYCITFGVLRDCAVAPLAIHPPHAANRHDAGSHSPGVGRFP